ncbi:hypothetical protein Sfulv_17400 [Streptomyces fulvorobeus]|uniref:Uncharacterized protein n=1 Tax=Streptomyces fulvorobeus TaxID=284028 RepID=A0A7J0C334_9ACTN|nr:hypothetical protein Sfulv_17400 [Streptomyces fulvorobeus]
MSDGVTGPGGAVRPGDAAPPGHRTGDVPAAAHVEARRRLTTGRAPLCTVFGYGAYGAGPGALLVLRSVKRLFGYLRRVGCRGLDLCF